MSDTPSGDEVIAEREALWQYITHGWGIEPRDYFEREAPKNGFKFPLVMAAHHLWKREVAEIAQEYPGGRKHKCTCGLAEAAPRRVP